MSYGFEAKNNNNQVLVSSETRNLHFVEKVTGPRNTTVSISDLDAGIIYSSNINGGIRRWRYTTYCSVTPVPFFTMPTNDFYGILRIVDKGNNRWDIEIFRSGTSNTVPELYIFADPRAAFSSNTHGMIVYRDDGTASFDSRVRPLVVNSAVTLTHPSNPRTVSNLMYNRSYAPFCGQVGADNASIFQSNQYNSYLMYTESGATRPAKPIFSFLSIAQSQRQITAYDTQGYNESFWGEEINRDYWYSYYWQFYRGAIRNPVGTGGLPRISTDTTATIQATAPYYNFDTTASIFYNGYGNNSTNWYNTGTRSGDDGLWLIALEWPINFTNREGTDTTAYNVMLLSTNGYITFNYYNAATGTYRDADAASFVFSNLATASTLSAARIMVYAADNSATKMGIQQYGTAPNRTNVIRYYGRPSASGWSGATTFPLTWEIQFPENKPDEIYIVFPATIQVAGGAVLGVGTSSGWQDIQIQSNPGTITPQNIVIKKGRRAQEYQAAPVIEAGWGTHDFGCNYYFYNSGGGGLIGGAFGPGSNTSVGGVWPYTNETLNLANNTVIIADGTKYGE